MDRFDALEERIDRISARGSAVEWVVEQIVANLLLQGSPAAATAFLNGLMSHGAPAYVVRDGRQEAPEPRFEAIFREELEKFVDRIELRVQQG